MRILRGEPLGPGPSQRSSAGPIRPARSVVREPRAWPGLPGVQGNRPLERRPERRRCEASLRERQSSEATCDPISPWPHVALTSRRLSETSPWPWPRISRPGPHIALATRGRGSCEIAKRFRPPASQECISSGSDSNSLVRARLRERGGRGEGSEGNRIIYSCDIFTCDIFTCGTVHALLQLPGSIDAATLRSRSCRRKMTRSTPAAI